MAAFLRLATKTKLAAQNRKGDLEPFVPGTAGSTSSNVEVSISCRNLPNKDLLSKSDPMAVIYHKPPGFRKWVPLMRTEIIQDDLNPDFVEKIMIEYRFEQVQQLRFEIFDIDSTGDQLTSHDMLGFLECSLGQIVQAGDSGLTLELQIMWKNFQVGAKIAQGTITLIAEEVGTDKEEVSLKLCGYNCGTWKFIIPPKTFFAIYKRNDAGNYVIVYRSSEIRGSNPTWPSMDMSCRMLCNSEMDRELRIDVFQKNISIGRSLVGSAVLSLRKLIALAGQLDRVELINAVGEVCKAKIRVQICTVTPMNTFVDYIQGGMQIQTIFAIDFTCSNGDPCESHSLHYLSPGNPNPYEQAIQAVGTILKDYDSTNLFPAFGFGARIPPKGDISYDFPLTLSKSPNCCSIPGVIEQYRSCVNKCQLYGPTYFSNVIKTVSKHAGNSKTGDNYYILVIITDGVITDVAKTKKAIVEASTLPMSIIIIGVGEAEFDAMEELDGDAVKVRYRKKLAKRDIVQFVAYRSARAWLSFTGETTATDIILPVDEETAVEQIGPDGKPIPPAEGDAAKAKLDLEKSSMSMDKSKLSAGKSQGNSTNGSRTDVSKSHEVEVPNPNGEDGPDESLTEETNRLAQGQLAAEVLQEIPDQIMSYMKMKGILPEHISANKKKAQQQQQAQAQAAAAAEQQEKQTS